ncbi:MAG: hypothetical protein QM719_11145 [Thermomonas sp.]
MAHSIGMTGMDPQTGAALNEALLQATRQVGGAWRVVGDQDADFVFVDMDSMYGPMSWIRLHANGKKVIGVTTASRTQADYHLARPFDTASVTALLQSIQVPGASGEREAPAAAEPATVPASATPAPAPTDQLPEEAVARRDEEQAPAMVEPVAAIPASAPAPPEPAPPPAVPEPVVPERDPVFVDWMAPGALGGYVRYQRGDGPALLIDADNRQYHGPAALKPLADAISGTVERKEFTMVPASEWPAQAKAAGEPQPLARLQWFAGLVAGHGSLLAGYDPQAKYRLTKWPQTEREFPKHFRIATVMMKAPATLAEIAEGSGVGIEEIADFVNANLATGYAEAWREPEPSPEPQKPGGLFGRLRGR